MRRGALRAQRRNSRTLRLPLHRMPKTVGVCVRISVVVARAAFRVTQGSPKFWSRSTDTGHTLECAFCADCGSRLWHQSSGAAETVNVKGGSLDDPVDLRSAVHIWTSRIQPGIVVADRVLQFPGEPG